MLTLGHLTRREKVEALLDAARDQGTTHPNRAMARGQARAIVHAVMWLYGVRDDSTSAAYAHASLEEAVFGADWFERRRLARELGLHTDAARRTSAYEVAQMRRELGLNPDPWTDA